MNEQNISSQKNMGPVIQNEENVLFGIVGALLFALAGGALYFVLYQIGILASISGLVCVICAIKGYSFFSKRESLRGVVISILIAILVLTAAWYFCLSYDVYRAYQEWYASGDVDFTLTFFESVSCAYLFLADVPSYFVDLGISLLLAVVGCFSYVSKMIKKAKTPEPQPAQIESEEI